MIRFLVIAISYLALACPALADGESKAKALELNWEEGTWWKTESRWLRDVSPTNGGPQVTGELLFHHKWVVRGVEDVDGRSCFILEIYPIDLPPEVQNDHGSDWLVRLALLESDLSLVRFEAHYRSGTYRVTGELKTVSVTYKEAKPVVSWFFIGVPWDIAVLPSQWLTGGAPGGGKELKYTDERSGAASVQLTVPYFASAEANTLRPAMFVTLSVPNRGVRTQRWEKGCPWWREWWCLYDNGKYQNLWYARTLSWGGKKESGADE